MSENTKKQTLKSRQNKSDKDNVYFLTLFNDDINSFDYVIDCLVEVCDHDIIQAEQSAIIAHYTGKCEIKKGNKSQLQKMHLALIRKGLKAGIE